MDAPLKIAICDNNSRKFTDDIIKHWEQEGHDVKYESGASEWLAQWADVYYCDTWDNNIHYLYKLYHDDPDHNRTPDWNNSKKPRIIVRVLDWEVWIGLVRDQAIIDWVDDIIFIAPHIRDRVLSEVAIPDKKVHLIRPGVNLDKFILKTKETDGFQLGMVLGDMWFPKQHMIGLDIFHQLWKKDKRWKLHIRGQHEGGNDYWKIMYDYYIESRQMQSSVILYDRVNDMSEWYENLDILLHPGMKEAFSYAVGESLAKGLKVVCNDFYGSRDIWNHSILYQDSDDAVNMIEQKNINKEFYRSLSPNINIMLSEYDQLIKNR